MPREKRPFRRPLGSAGASVSDKSCSDRGGIVVQVSGTVTGKQHRESERQQKDHVSVD